MKRHALLLLLWLWPAGLLAQNMRVTVVNRAGTETGFSRHIPGTSNSDSSGSAYCASGNCSANISSQSTYSDPHEESTSVNGSQLVLLLPDGRKAVIACDYKRTIHSVTGLRDCRVPPIDQIDAAFSGNKVKLSWSVSLDGKKKETETYKMVSVIAAP